MRYDMPDVIGEVEELASKCIEDAFIVKKLAED